MNGIPKRELIAATTANNHSPYRMLPPRNDAAAHQEAVVQPASR
jgi:hypothetical protein